MNRYFILSIGIFAVVMFANRQMGRVRVRTMRHPQEVATGWANRVHFKLEAFGEWQSLGIHCACRIEPIPEETL